MQNGIKKYTVGKLHGLCVVHHISINFSSSLFLLLHTLLYIEQYLINGAMLYHVLIICIVCLLINIGFSQAML